MKNTRLSKKLMVINSGDKNFQSNQEKTSIFSIDGTKIYSVINSIKNFEIPSNVRVIKMGSFSGTSINEKLIIPASVEIIEDEAFYD